MIKFYSSHCSKCVVLEKMMNQKKIEFELVEDEDVYMPIAEENGILSMPFAEVNGEIMNTVKLQKYIMEYKGE